MPDDIWSQLGITVDDLAELAAAVPLRLTEFLLRWEHFAAALECAEWLAAHKPEQVSAYDTKARALEGLGHAEEALAVMQARHQLRVSLTSRMLEARLLLAANRSDAALALTEGLLRDNPDSAYALGLLIDIYIARKDYAAAQAACQRLARLAPEGRAYRLRMLALHQAQGHYVNASAYAVLLEHAIEEGEGGQLPAYLLRRLRDYYRASGEVNRVEDMERALAELYERELATIREVLGRREPSRPVAIEAAPQPAETPRGAFLVRDTVPVSPAEQHELEEAARAWFGYDRLLPGQVETMAAIRRGEDVLTILPTGGGKSLCYQLPALMDERGATLVISPLIALMKDQLDNLPDRARSLATTINSSLEGDELARRIQNTARGAYRLVYAAPERLRQPPFLHALARVGVNRLVIDEAHCVSVWGHDFRPDYLHIADARRILGDPPILAMTATAPGRVRQDIARRMGRAASGEEPHMTIVANPVHRPNLYLEAIAARDSDERLARLLALCRAETGSGIIYVDARAKAEQLAALLNEQGISAGFYHAGIGDRTARDAAQDAFMSGQVRIMVATIAFGMGIDKRDIRFIIHHQLPQSLEAYYQEAGRAGRDGLPARCTLLWAPTDRGNLTRRAHQDALSLDQLRAVYAAVRRRLAGASLGHIAADDLLRDLQSEETTLRVALSLLEEAALLRRYQDAPRTALVSLAAERPDERQWADGPAFRRFATAARLQPGVHVPLDLTAVALAAQLDPREIESLVLAWADAGWLTYRPAGRDLLIELLPAPPDAQARVATMLEQYAALQTQRIDEIVAYARTRRCRHGHISAYLGGEPLTHCGACDRCRPAEARHDTAASGLPGEAEQLTTILRTVESMSWGRVSLVAILRGDTRRAAYGSADRWRQSPGWGRLAFRSTQAVGRLIDRLAEAGLLTTRTLEHGGVVFELTPAGRAALREPGRLAALVETPRPTAVPAKGSDASAEGPLDETLFQRLRAWRLEMARAAHLPSYGVAPDAVLRRIAATHPRTLDELAALKGIGPRKLAQYGEAILALVRGEKEQAG